MATKRKKWIVLAAASTVALVLIAILGVAWKWNSPRLAHWGKYSRNLMVRAKDGKNYAVEIYWADYEPNPNAVNRNPIVMYIWRTPFIHSTIGMFGEKDRHLADVHVSLGKIEDRIYFKYKDGRETAHLMTKYFLERLDGKLVLMPK